MATDIKEKNYVCNDPQLEEIHEALIKEYEAVSKRQNEQKITLYNGLLQQSLPNKFLYKFETPNDPDKKFEPDKPHTLSIDGNVIDGSIISINENYIEIELRESFGKLIPSIDIIIDLRILLDLIDRRIVLIDKEPNNFKIQTAKNLFNPDPVINDNSPLGSVIDHNKRQDMDKGLNPEQISAIKNAISKKLTIIWGPPGTGKTKTLQGVIAELLANNKKVLFASNTNNAIDGLLKDFKSKTQCPYSKINELREKGKIVRIGAQTCEDVKNVFSPKAVIEKKSEDLLLKIKQLENLLSTEQKIFNKIISEINDYRKAKELKPEIENLKIKLNELPEISIVEKKIKKLTFLKESLLSELSKNSLDTFQAVNELSEFAAKLSAIKEKLIGTNAQIYRIENEITNCKNEFIRTSQERNRIASNFLKKLFNQEKIEFLNSNLLKLRNTRNLLVVQLRQYRKLQKSQLDEESQYTGRFANIFNSMVHRIDLLEINYRKLETLLAQFNIRINVKESSLLWLETAGELGLCSKDKAHNFSYLRGFSTIKKETIIKKYEQQSANLESQKENLKKYKTAIQEALDRKQKDLSEKAHLLTKPDGYWTELNDTANRIQLLKIQPLKEQILQLTNDLKEIENTIIADADLVCATLVKVSYDETLMKLAFDVLVADEISMVSLPQLYCASSLISEKIILSGDRLQLQPIATSQAEIAEKWLKKSYFHFSEKNSIDLKPFTSNLSTQFRMPSIIADLVRDWYKKEGNSIQDGEFNKNCSLNFNFNNHFLNDGTIFFIDTSPLNSYHSRTSDKSPYNLINAAIVAEITRELNAGCGVKPKDIFCISPYRAQYQLTRTLLKKFINPDFERIANSVHKVQGSEAPIVFYDLTDGRQKGFTAFLKTPDLFIHNVAITRCKNKLIFVGDFAKLEKLKDLDTEKSPAFLDIFKKIKKSAIKIDATPYKNKIFKSYTLKNLLDDSTINFSSEKNNIVILNSATYYKALNEDILKARKSILIISPFMTKNRWEKVKPFLVSFKSKNPDGKIKILSKPPDQMYEINKINMAAVKILNEFLDLGFEVKVSKKIHAKLVVLDQGTKNAISYWGSLNPLSFNNTDEINTRLDGAEIAEKLINMSMVGNLKNYKRIPFRANQYKTHTKEAVLKQLKNFRFTLAGYYHRMLGSICSNATLDSIVEILPKTKADYLQISEFNKRNFLLWNHLDEINEIISPLRDFDNY